MQAHGDCSSLAVAEYMSIDADHGNDAASRRRDEGFRRCLRLFHRECALFDTNLGFGGRAQKRSAGDSTKNVRLQRSCDGNAALRDDPRIGGCTFGNIAVAID